MPTVSVIIPTYNRSEFLHTAITSVLNQTFQDLEIVVVDDASTDNTFEVVSRFYDSRIKYIHHDINKGGSAARNSGIRASSGKYIAFLDDDDEWLPAKLKIQIELLKNSPEKVGGVYTGYSAVDRGTGKVLSQFTPSKRGNLFHDLCIENFVGTASTLLLRKDCFTHVGLFDESLASGQEYDMLIRISKEFHFEYIKESFVRYYVHESRISTNLEAKIKGIEILLKKYSQFFALNSKSYSRLYLALGVCYCYNGNIKMGRKSFLGAIKLYPFEIRNYFNFCLSLLGADAFKELKEIKDKLAAPFRAS